MTSNSRDLTARQRDVLDWIIESLREQGYPPTVREIAQHFGMASAYGVQRHIAALQKKGYLYRESGARAITLAPSLLQNIGNNEGACPLPPEPLVRTRMLPIVGRVAAGLPITAEENVEEHIPWPEHWLRGKEDVFILKVKGDSMAPGIEDGDLLLVQAQTAAENGALVVALVDGEATVKRFFRDRSRVVLRADNPAYSDIVLNSSFRVNGRVVSLIRHC